jgi:hypothetical protein
MELADIAEAERALDTNRELVAGLGQPMLTWATLHHHATLRAVRAEPDTEAAIDAAHEFAVRNAHLSSAALRHLSQRWTLLKEHARLTELLEPVRHLAESTRYPLMVAAHAVVLSDIGDRDAAAALFDELVASGFAQPTHNAGWLFYFCWCAELCADFSRRDCVPALESRLGPWGDQLAVGSFAGAAFGPVSFYLGLLARTAGDWERAESSFAAAAATQERIGAPILLARTRIEWARMLLTRAAPNDGQRAHDLLRHALDTAREREQSRLEADAVALLSGA